MLWNIEISGNSQVGFHIRGGFGGLAPHPYFDCLTSDYPTILRVGVFKILAGAEETD